MCMAFTSANPSEMPLSRKHSRTCSVMFKKRPARGQVEPEFFPIAFHETGSDVDRALIGIRNRSTRSRARSSCKLRLRAFNRSSSETIPTRD